MEQLTARQLQAQQTKESIYNAAITLFEKNGYENVLIEDITNEAKCAKGTFYLYYTSKKELLYDTVVHYNLLSDQAYEKVREISDFREKFIRYIRLYYEGVKRMGKQILRALVGNNVLDGERDIINAPDRSIYRVLEEILSEGIAQGCLSDAHEVSYYRDAFVSTVLGADYYWCTKDDVDISEFIVKQTNIFLDGLMEKARR